MYECYTRYRAEEKEIIVLTVKRSELSISGALKRFRNLQAYLFMIGIPLTYPTSGV